MVKKSSSLKFLLAAIGAAFIWGFLTIPLQHLHALNYTSQQILYFRVFVSFAILISYSFGLRLNEIQKDVAAFKAMPFKDRNKMAGLLLLTGILITTNWFTYIYVVNHIGVKVAGFGYLICPLITAAGGFIILREKLSKVKVTGILLAIGSIAVLSTGSLEQALWSVLVALSYSIYLILQRVITQFDKTNVLLVQLLISTVILLPFYINQHTTFPTQAVFWFDTVAIAVLFTIIPLLLSLYALSGLPSSTIGITIYINPIITFAVAFLYFHEGFERSQLTGYAMLLVSVIIFNWQMIQNAFSKTN